MRDEQRERVYEAEWRLQNMLDTADRISNRMVTLDGIALTLPTEYKFASVAGVQRYCDRRASVANRRDPDARRQVDVIILGTASHRRHRRRAAQHSQ